MTYSAASAAEGLCDETSPRRNSNNIRLQIQTHPAPAPMPAYNTYTLSPKHLEDSAETRPCPPGMSPQACPPSTSETCLELIGRFPALHRDKRHHKSKPPEPKNRAPIQGFPMKQHHHQLPSLHAVWLPGRSRSQRQNICQSCCTTCILKSNAPPPWILWVLKRLESCLTNVAWLDLLLARCCLPFESTQPPPGFQDTVNCQWADAEKPHRRQFA